MTEKEFDQKVEDMDARFERGIEASAAKLEKGVTPVSYTHLTLPTICSV